MNPSREVDNTFIDAYKSKFNLLIVTATDIEKDFVREHLKPLPTYDNVFEIQKQKYTYFIGVFGVFYAVHVACNEMGSIGRAASLITTVDAINVWSPTVVLMIGIAFGSDRQKQKIGDILVAERILSYEPQKIGEKSVLARGKEGPASSLLLDRFKSVSGWNFKDEDGKTPEIITGLVLSGEKLIDNPLFKSKLMIENPQAIGGEMEGAGIYAACDQRVKDWILVKGICDFADGNKSQNKDEFQRTAIKNAVSLCEFVFSKPFGFKDVDLVVHTDVLKADFFVEKGAIPEWMFKKAKSLAKEIRHED